MIIKISESSKKRCREKFQIKKIGKLINSAVSCLELVPVETVIAEFIYDQDNPSLYNVMLFLIRENCKDEVIISSIQKFEYLTI